MAGVIPFTRYEAALLLDAYLSSVSDNVPRNRAAKELSQVLRQMAVNNGIEIDNSFRSSAGLAGQLESMESAYAGETVHKPAHRIFKEIVSVYKEDRREYDKLLCEARAMVEGKRTIEEQFRTWLLTELPSEKRAKILMCYPEIERFAQNSNLIVEPLFSTTDIDILNEAQQAMMNNRLYKLVHMKQMKAISAAFSYYIKFISEMKARAAAEDRVTSKKGEGEKAKNRGPAAKTEQKQAPTAAIDKAPEDREKAAAQKQEKPAAQQRSAEELVKAAIKKECAFNQYGTTAEYLQTQVNEELSEINRILSSALWAKQVDGRYHYVEPCTDDIKKAPDSADAEVSGKMRTQGSPDSPEKEPDQEPQTTSTSQKQEPHKQADNREPSAEELVRAAIKKECEYNKYGTTAVYLHSQIPIKTEEIIRILNAAPWAKQVSGRYHYLETNEPTAKKALDMKPPAIISGTPAAEKAKEPDSTPAQKPAKQSAEEKTAPAQTQVNQPAKDEPEPRFIRTENDKALAEKYPIIYKRVFASLQKLTDQRGKALSSVTVLNDIGSNFRLVDIRTVLRSASWSEENGDGSFRYTDGVALHEKNKEYQSVDFQKIRNLSGTKPKRVLYFTSVIAEDCSWADAYVKLVSALYDDHPYDIPVGRSFNGRGRVDFGNEQIAKKMLAPKPVFMKMYLETDISPTIIAEKIKALLDICNVDYEKVVVEYETDLQIVPEPPATSKAEEKHPEVSAAEESSFSREKDFSAYLNNVCKLSANTSRSYVSSVRAAERYAHDRWFPHRRLFGCSKASAASTARDLLEDRGFAEYNEQEHYRFSIAIRKFIDYTGDVVPPVEKSSTSAPPARKPAKKTARAEEKKPAAAVIKVPPARDTAPYKKVLEERFVKGFRLDSALELKKFRRCYEELNGTASDKSDQDLGAILKSCGIVHEGKVFMPRTMVSDEIGDKLLRYIRDTFASGRTAIYYEALFREFSEDFLDYYIYNADMLRAYLEYVNDGSYFAEKRQLAQKAGAVTNPLEEIRTCLKESGGPMKTELLCNTLTHIPERKIKFILGSNLEFVRNGNGEYFHADTMALTEEELSDIAELIEQSIQARRYISGTELMKELRAKYPHICEEHSAYSDSGWRDALKYKLNGRFAFKGNIISAPGDAFYTSDIFGELAETRDPLTLQELTSLAAETGVALNLDAVYKKAIRLNKDTFVPKYRSGFRTAETDAALDRSCTGKYIPICAIREFGTFPDAGFPWTSYLLESYAASFSEKYTLLHASYNRDSTAGAIVKKSANYMSFGEVLVDVLADSDIPLSRADALRMLSREGYILWSFSGIEDVLIKAKAQRNEKGRK